ncbi:MAG: SUMF1/EgtB/PvdO family nonheme iron enzyme, partial [Candidatus Latescibacterota bacterium]
PPTADAGPDQMVHVGDMVSLDGSGSSDPDTGDVLSYAWTVSAGVILSSTTVPRPAFTPGEAKSYRFILVVSDGHQNSSPDTVTVTVANRPPTANAGPDQAVHLGDTVTLDGRGSSDPDGDALTYRWTAPGGITLRDSTDARPRFTAVTPGEHSFTLVVRDGVVDSAPDEVIVAAAEPAPPRDTLTVDLPGGTTMEFVWIEPGTFTMGDVDLGDTNTPHQVTIREGFWLGRYEITQGQWQSVMGTAPWSGQSYVREGASYPAVYVSWAGFQAFVHGLNKATEDSLYRLPTEAEWEYACRAGTTTRWSYGDDEGQQGQYAWYLANAWNAGERYAHAVGTKLSNPWGLYDMHGNVFEWVQDWYAAYNNEAQTDPRGPATGQLHVYRGGSFRSDASDTRSARRTDNYSVDANCYFGARLLRMIEPVPVNRPPVADAGPDQTVNAGATVILDGSGSSDPDADPLTYRWSAPGEVTLSTAAAVRPTFTARAGGLYAFVLVVNDGHQDSSPDTVVVTVANRPPTANAGTDQTVSFGATVQLDGSGSSDPDAGDVLSYVWTAPVGVSLSSATVSRPTFAAGGVGSYRFGLVVSDGQASSVADSVVVTVQGLERVPPDLTVDLLPGGATMDFIWIAPGTFLMGSPDSDPLAYDEEKPQHQVTVSQGFYLGQYEVTQGQWQAVMGTTPWAGKQYVQASAGNPAVHISWYDLQGFVYKLNQAAGGLLYRLPTEAEWEYACRAGTTTRWSFGDDAGQLPQYAWYSDNTWNVGLLYAQPVGAKLPNPWGLYDMGGNVDEWVQDWYGSYSSGAQADPWGAATGSHRVFRGGGFSNYGIAPSTRSGARGDFPPDGQSYGIGTRLLMMARPVAVNRPPMANAGPDQAVRVGDTVALDGTGSSDPDGDALSYAWTTLAGVTLSSVTVAQPTFTAGGVGTYRFGLEVSDGWTSSPVDTVVVTVANRAPTANAGYDQTVNVGATVALDGSGSSDPDGDLLSYAWTAPAEATLSSTAV